MLEAASWESDLLLAYKEHLEFPAGKVTKQVEGWLRPSLMTQVRCPEPNMVEGGNWILKVIPSLYTQVQTDILIKQNVMKNI